MPFSSIGAGTGGAIDALTTRREDGTYTASNEEHIVSDGGTITLPSPTSDGIVLVSQYDTVRPSVEAPSGSIDGANSISPTVDYPLVFVSDGTNWYVSDSRDSSLAIPDSAIHQWTFGEGSGTTVADSVGTADGTVNGASWVSGTWKGGNALSFDGVDDYVETTQLGDFGSQHLFDHTIFVTIDTSTTSSGSIHGYESSTSNDNFDLRILTDGTIRWYFANDDSTGDRYYVDTQSSFNDGSPHRIALRLSGQSDQGVSIFADGVDQTLDVGEPGTVDPFGDFDNPLYIGNKTPEDGFVFDGIIDNPIISSTAVADGVVSDDYDSQPWS